MMLQIDMIGGNCPVQAEGTISGQSFYFRARGEHWSMGIGGDPVGDPDWHLQERWGDSKYAAGWMPEDEARKIIEQCAREYLARGRGRTDVAFISPET